MSSLLKSLHKGKTDASTPPTRMRNDSTSGIGLEDPGAVDLEHALFTNAYKAITQGQPQLLSMFMKKHPHIVTITGPVKSEPVAMVSPLPPSILNIHDRWNAQPNILENNESSAGRP